MAPEPIGGPPKDLPRVIGGYRVLRELGRGRLGLLLHARRRASSEDVALRVIRTEWSCLPVYVSRLIRNAHAAAQVEHPNLVPILDLGEAQRRFFVSTGFIHGQTLAERVVSQGPFIPREAVAIALQTARGLRTAHAQGLSHGDVSPTTIFLDRDGRIRLAELGLTRTPASVASEEAREKTGPITLATIPGELNLEGVRADLKGLGKTLAFLLTGQPGNTDATSLIGRGVPVNLVELVRSLIESRTGSGFSDVGQAVAAFEKYLNAKSVGGTTPREEDALILQESLKAFQGSPTALIRERVVTASVATCSSLILLALIAKLPLIAGSLLGLGLMTVLARFCIKGVTGRDSLFPDVRTLIFESRGADLAIVAAGLSLFVVALVVLHLQWAWLCLGILAVVMAVGLHHFCDLPIETERKGAIEEGQSLVRDLRRKGVAEEAIRSFIRGASGEEWGPFFEALFGEEARRAAWTVFDRKMFMRLKHPVFTIRSLVASWIQGRLNNRRRERDAAFFQYVEEQGLVAEGVNLLTARRKSRRIAAAMVAVTSEHRDALKAATKGANEPAADRPSVAFAVKQAVEAPEEVLVEHEQGPIRPDRSVLISLLTGPRTRFLLGSLILAGFLLWVHQNGIISGDQIKDVAVKAIESEDLLKSVRDARIDVRIPGRVKALDVPLAPRVVTGAFNGFHSGVAGLILMISSFFRGSRVGYFAFPGAAVSLLGPSLGLTALGPFDPSTASMAAGAAIASLGIFFGKTEEE